MVGVRQQTQLVRFREIDKATGHISYKHFHKIMSSKAIPIAIPLSGTFWKNNFRQNCQFLDTDWSIVFSDNLKTRSSNQLNDGLLYLH